MILLLRIVYDLRLGECQQTQLSVALSEITNENFREDLMAVFDSHALLVRSLMHN